MSRRGRAASPRRLLDSVVVDSGTASKRERVLLAVASGADLQIEVLRRRRLPVAREALELDGADVLEFYYEGRLVDEGQRPLERI